MARSPNENDVREWDRETELEVGWLVATSGRQGLQRMEATYLHYDAT